MLFEPQAAAAVEDFFVDVSTCYNHSYLKTEILNGVNVSTNVTELECKQVMEGE